jgi:hypothetical protein
MTISQSDLEDLDRSLGSGLSDASLSGDDAPNGNNLLGALNHTLQLGEEMDEYDLTYSDLNADKQTELDEYVEDLRYHLEKLANVLGADLVGADTGIELPNGNTLDLPSEATAAGGNTSDLPSDPR